MRKFIAAVVGVAVVAVPATFALVFGPDKKSTLDKGQRAETARLFAPVYDLSPAPARDLIAIQLQTLPVVWPQVPIPRVKPNVSKPTKQIKQAQKRNPTRQTVTDSP